MPWVRSRMTGRARGLLRLGTKVGWGFAEVEVAPIDSAMCLNLAFALLQMRNVFLSARCRDVQYLRVRARGRHDPPCLVDFRHGVNTLG